MNQDERVRARANAHGTMETAIAVWHALHIGMSRPKS